MIKKTVASSGSGTVTSVSGAAPISVATGTTTPVVSIVAADGSTEGSLTASAQTIGGVKTFSAQPVSASGYKLSTATLTDVSGQILATSTAVDGAAAVAFKLVSAALSTSGAKLLSLLNNATEKVAITKDGAATFSSTVNATNFEIPATGALYNTSIAQSLVLESSKQPTGGAVSVKTDTNGWTFTEADDLLGAMNNGSERFGVDGAGMPRLGIGNAIALPTAAVGHRGKLWFTSGGAGVADTLKVCIKGADDLYSWKTVTIL